MRPPKPVIAAGLNEKVHEVVGIRKIRPPSQPKNLRWVQIQPAEKNFPLLAFEINVYIQVFFPLGLDEFTDETVEIPCVEDCRNFWKAFSVWISRLRQQGSCFLRIKL